MSKWRNLNQNGFTFHHVKCLIMERCPKNRWWKSSEAAAKRNPQPSRRSSQRVTSQQHQVCCQSLRIFHRKQTVPGSDFLKGLWRLVIRIKIQRKSQAFCKRLQIRCHLSWVVEMNFRWSQDFCYQTLFHVSNDYANILQWSMMIHKILIEISFTISDCPLENNESPAWKCSCRVCIKPPNISMQHGIQVPENFCVSVCFFWEETLYPTLLLSQITNLENKNHLGNFPKTLQNQHHQETRGDPNRIPVSDELQGSHLGHLMRCKPGKTKALHRCSDQHTSTNPERKNSLIHVFGLAVVFWFITEKVMKRW